MKKIITSVVLLMTACTFSYAQCDKKVLLTASKTEFLAADGSVQRSEEESTTIEFDKTSIIIQPGDRAKLTGTIKSVTCNWTTPFKDGKIVLKTSLIEEGDGTGEHRDITITIEGKGGKISFLAAVDGQPDKRINLVVEKFEEKAK